MYLSKDQILKVTDLQYEDIECPEWNGIVRVRGLTAREWDDFEAGTLKSPGMGEGVNLANYRARLCVKGMVDEVGQPLFNDSDLQSLSRKSSAPIKRIFSAIRRLSGKDEEEQKAIEKNLSNGPINGSIIGLPSLSDAL